MLKPSQQRFRVPSVNVFLAASLCWSLTICIRHLSSQETATPDGQAANFMKRGLDLAAHGELAQSEILLEQAREAAPDNLEVLTSLAKVKGRLGEMQASIVIFREVLARTPGSAEAHLNLAIALADSSDLAGALEEASKAVELSPGFASARLNRARILVDLHRPDEATADFEIASRLEPTNPDCFFYSALAEKEIGNFAKESALLRKLLRLQPENVKALGLLADALENQSRQSEAIAVWRRWLQIDPNSSEATYGLAQALRKTEPNESERLLERFKELKQRDKQLEQVKVLGNQAYVSMMNGQWAAAVSPLRDAIVQCGNCEVLADLHKDLGLALLHTGNAREGRAELRTALRLNPSDRDALKGLAAISPQQ